MITHTIIHNSLDDFRKVYIEEPDHIVGFYVELTKSGAVRGSYITDNRYPAICDYTLIQSTCTLLTPDNRRVWRNIPLELYLENYQNFIKKECYKMQKKWKQVPYDDLRQMFCEALVKCRNKNGYILNSRLILRSFYNTVYTYIRKNFNFMINTSSLDDNVMDEEDQVSLLDMIEDEESNPEFIQKEKEKEEEYIEKLALISKTLKDLGYSERVMKNIMFELDKHAQSRETKRIIDQVKERLSREGWL